MVRDPRWSRTDVVLAASVLAVAVWLVADVLFVVFAGVLLAIGLDALGCTLARHTPLSRGWAVAIVLVVLAALVAAGAALILPMLLDQLNELWTRLEAMTAQLRATLGRYGMLRWMAQEGDAAGAAQEAVSQVASWGMALLVGIAGLIIVVVIMLFAVANPALYRRGILHLFPFERRDRIDDTLSAIARALRWWFLGQLVSMAILGTTVSLGLLVIGVDLWLALGLVTAVLTFIPFLGPMIAGIPVIAFGFVEGIQTGLIVTVFYLIIQNVEGNILTPWIQQRAVYLPPVVLITVQVLMGSLFGVLGLVMAAPATVLGMVMVQKLYVEDVLGDSDYVHK